MALPSDLIECYHSVTGGGQPLLTTDGRDYFPAGREPRLRRIPTADAPDCAGRADGELYDRGNVRAEASISRVRCFLDYSYPLTDGDITASSPEEYAQKWLVQHLEGFNEGGLAWTGRRTWPRAIITVDGTTEGGWAVVDYSIQLSGAA